MPGGLACVFGLLGLIMIGGGEKKEGLLGVIWIDDLGLVWDWRFVIMGLKLMLARGWWIGFRIMPERLA